jgi:hypothetical protein
MKISISSLFLILFAALPLTVAAAEPEVIYWNSDAGKVLRARIAPDAESKGSASHYLSRS